MAIYTQYGRYQKAKLFKEMLESAGDTYMLLGLGNPYWDRDELEQSIPVAPYDTSMINPDPSVNGNQFLDEHINQYFSNTDYANPPINISANIEQSLINGVPNSEQDPTQSGKYLNICKDLIPPFPCIWQNYNYTAGIIDSQQFAINLDNYQNYYIDSRNNFTKFYLKDYNDIVEEELQFPTDNYERQFFSELVLRGYARNLGQGDNNLKYYVKHPAGLFGAVKVGISFVKDIGTSLDNSTYNGYVDQFWYGDRYWEVVDPNEDTLESYIDGDTNKIYPHHLLFSATINPRQLFTGNLNVDQNLIPRQIALYSKKATPINVVNNTVVYSNGPNVYRVGDYVFNFGQYTNSDIANLTSSGQYDSTHILNFTFPCSTDNENRSDANSYPQGDFKFILNDYIKGTVRNRHSVDRVAYIVGF